jgi:two-component system NtrC family sensor kinase
MLLAASSTRANPLNPRGRRGDWHGAIATAAVAEATLAMAAARQARRNSLRVLILTLGAATLLPLVVLGYAAWSIDAELRRDAEERINIELDVLTQHALKALQTAELAMRAMQMLMPEDQSDAEIVAREPQLHAQLHALRAGLPGVQSMWLIGRDGTALVSDFVSPVPALNASDRDFFHAAAAGYQGTYIGGVYAPKLPGPPFFSVSRRRDAGHGDATLVGPFNGVLDVSLLPSDFADFYRQLDPTHKELYALARPGGDMITRFPPGPAAQTVLNPAVSPFMHALAGNARADRYTAVSSVDGVERMLGYRQVPGYELYTLVGIPTASLWAAWRAALEHHLIFGAPATLLMITALLIAIQRTRRLYTEAEGRRAAEAALSRTQRMEAMGQLTGGVAHDFNNLLTIILVSSDSLAERVTDTRDQRSIELIQSAGQRGVALVRQLLAFARSDPLAAETVDLTRHVAGMAEMLRRSLRGDIELDTSVPADASPVKVDPGELDFALLNIAVNARDAMPQGGRLCVAVRPVLLDGNPVTDSLKGPFVALSVTDNGAGIPAFALSRVFEPFFTTKEAGKGTGLGLSQVYGFARRSGGTVTIASEVGRGTTVTIYLPRSTEGVSAAGAKPPSHALSGQGRRVLLVEDNGEVREVMRSVLRGLGFGVNVADGAHAALDLLGGGARFDLLLTDVVMPGDMNGIQLAREVRHLYPDLPVLLNSGYHSVAEGALREGYAFLQKPYDVDRLRGAIDAALLPAAGQLPGGYGQG